MYDMPAKAVLSTRFRISIPRSICAAQRWSPGQKLAFVPKDGNVVLVAVPSLAELRGIACNAYPDRYRDRNERY